MSGMFMMYPALYAAKNFMITRQKQWEILHTKWAYLEDAVKEAKRTGIALREENWFVCEVGWFGRKKRISLAKLAEWGLILPRQTTDFIGSYYEWL